MDLTYLTHELRALHQAGNIRGYLRQCCNSIIVGNAMQKTISRLSIYRLHRVGLARLNHFTRLESLKLISSPHFAAFCESSQSSLAFKDLPQSANLIRLGLEKADNAKSSVVKIAYLRDYEWMSTELHLAEVQPVDIIAIALAFPASIVIADCLCPSITAIILSMKIIWSSHIVCNYLPANDSAYNVSDALPYSAPTRPLGNIEISRMLAADSLIPASILALYVPLFDARVQNRKGSTNEKVVISTKAYSEGSYSYDRSSYTGSWLDTQIGDLAGLIVGTSIVFAKRRLLSIDSTSHSMIAGAISPHAESKRIATTLWSKATSIVESLSEENDRYAQSYLDLKAKADRRSLRILIGTLYSGESELQSLEHSLSRQSYPIAEHFIVKNLPNVEAHNRLYEYFLSSDHDILIKLDADMVLTDNKFIERMAKGCIWSRSFAIIQSSIFDYYSGGEIQGVNCYSKLFKWDPKKTDAVFVDRSAITGLKKVVVWSTFIRSVIHCPSPHPFQAFHFGIHRVHKARVAYNAGNYESAIEQLTYLEKLRKRYRQNIHSSALAYAYIGYLYGLVNSVDASLIDYTNDYLRNVFDGIQSLTDNELCQRIKFLERQETQLQGNAIVDLSIVAQSGIHSGVHRVGLLVPHLQSFGGIFRFIELAIRFRRRGLDALIIIPDEAKDEAQISWISQNYEELSCVTLSNALLQDWDVVICGDFSSGIMCYLPLFKARLRCSYLLNGWQHRHINVRQIEAVSPEIVIANSSYCASHYHDLFPKIVPGGIDFERISLFKKAIQRDIDLSNDVIRVACPSGRLKPRKRFNDAIEALVLLSEKGFKIELNTFDIVDIELSGIGSIRHVHHRGLSRDSLFKVISDMDLGIYPEEDAGWNNPVAEAACCCLPVVCTSAGTSDFILHQVSGFVVQPRSPKEIADFAEKLILDRHLRETHSSNAFTAIKAFDWQRVADHLIVSFDETRHTRAVPSLHGMKGVDSLIKSLA